MIDIMMGSIYITWKSIRNKKLRFQQVYVDCNSTCIVLNFILACKWISSHASYVFFHGPVIVSAQFKCLQHKFYCHDKNYNHIYFVCSWFWILWFNKQNWAWICANIWWTDPPLVPHSSKHPSKSLTANWYEYGYQYMYMYKYLWYQRACIYVFVGC